MKRPALVRLSTAALACAAALSWLGLGCSTAEPARPPNVVLIISDDHSWHHYSFMGHEAIQTPHIDRLASESLVYTRGYVPTSLCRPSLATIITGLYPHQHGITGNDPPGEMRDPENRQTMVDIFKQSKTVADLLAKEGYVSHQSGKWWEGQCQCGGFTHCMTHGDVTRGGRHGDEGLKIGRETMQPIYDFIDEASGKPYLLWYAPFLPHTPHNPPDRLLEKYQAEGRPEAIAKYYAMVEWFDETVGDLLGFIEKRGDADNTIVIYLQDNGWEQSEDPRLWYETKSKVSPYDAGLRTPIMVRWPGRVLPERDDLTLVSSIDIAPTILEAVGAGLPGELPGINLLDRATLEERKTIFGNLFAHTAVDVEDPVKNLKYRWAVRHDGWKLILPYAPNEDVELMINGLPASWIGVEPELFNVLDDPFETRNQAAERPDLAEALTEEIQRWWRVP
jgi:arylsulfatase A-like enzyme